MSKKVVKERTEEDKVTIAPIEVMLGGQKYRIEQLRIKDSRGWRKSVVKLMTDLPGYVDKAMTKDADFFDALNGLIVTMPDAVIDLFFSYARDLDRDEIEEIASESELSLAWDEVIKVAFPLLKSIPQAMGRLSQ